MCSSDLPCYRALRDRMQREPEPLAARIRDVVRGIGGRLGLEQDGELSISLGGGELEMAGGGELAVPAGAEAGVGGTGDVLGAPGGEPSGAETAQHPESRVPVG